jgi:hypothetical protein
MGSKLYFAKAYCFNRKALFNNFVYYSGHHCFPEAVFLVVCNPAMNEL